MSENRRIVLLALTGFGNPVLEVLHSLEDWNVALVVTEEHVNPFPYYSSEPLASHCRRLGIPVRTDLDLSGSQQHAQGGKEVIAQSQPDLLLVATFRQILSTEILQVPRFGTVNFHPSLLPWYRGPNPTNAVLRAGESVTGVTAHYVIEKPDSGNILLQQQYDIPPDSSDGELRFALATLSAEMLPEVLGMFQKETLPAGRPQPDGDYPYAARPRPEDGELERYTSFDEMAAVIRAFTPYPGASYLYQGERLKVSWYQWFSPEEGQESFRSPAHLNLCEAGRGLRLLLDTEGDGVRR